MTPWVPAVRRTVPHLPEVVLSALFVALFLVWSWLVLTGCTAAVDRIRPLFPPPRSTPLAPTRSLTSGAPTRPAMSPP